MAIILSDNIENRSPKPLDSRTVVEDYSDLANTQYRHDGLEVWVKSDRYKYRFHSDVNDWIRIEEFGAGADNDNRYGPYDSTTADPGGVFHVDSPIYTLSKRYRGLMIGVIIDSIIIEHWFELGVEDSNLVIKIIDGGSF